MAVIKKGKIHGKIGKYVYRVVNGIEIVQSFPKPVAPSGNTRLENMRFGAASKTSANVYRLIKDFGLAKTDGSFYPQWMRFINKNLYGSHNIRGQAAFSDWNLVPSSTGMPVNEYVKVEDILHGLPEIVIEQDSGIISVPHYEFKRKRNYLIQEADYLEYSISVIHYDFELEQATAFFEYNSGRFLKLGGFPAQVMEFPMVDNGVPIVRGLIVACIGIRFFGSERSYGYLNTKECNPVNLIGSLFKI